MPENNNSTLLILKEIRSLRSEMNEGFRETRSDIQETNTRINHTDSNVAQLDKKVEVNKVKIGILVSVIVAIGQGVSRFFIEG